MSRRKPVDAVAADLNEPTQGITVPPTDAASNAATGTQAPDATRTKWTSRFPQWADSEAGVHLIEDRRNRRMTIKFDEKPSEAVRALMKSEEHGYRFDGEDEVWYKKISPGKPIPSRQEAEELAFKVANMVREEKGLEQKKSFSLAL